MARTTLEQALCAPSLPPSFEEAYAAAMLRLCMKEGRSVTPPPTKKPRYDQSMRWNTHLRRVKIAAALARTPGLTMVGLARQHGVTTETVRTDVKAIKEHPERYAPE